jgi:tetratricopeptide (TPR) repeat protein
MRRLNIRLIGVLALVMVIFGAAVHWLHGYQVRRNAHVFLREAERAKEAKKFGDAVRNFQWYVELVPNDVAVLWEFGALLADLPAYEPAYATLERVLRLDPSRTNARRRLVAVAIELGRYRDAREHLERNLLKAAPADGELLTLLGICQEAATQFADAAQSYRAAIHSSPERLATYLRLAELLRRRLEKADEADQRMAAMVDANPKSAEAHVMYGRYLRTGNKPDQAMDQAQKALALAADNVDALHLAVQCAAELRRPEEARRYGAKAIELFPHHIPLYTALADVETLADRRGDAITWLRKGLEKNPGQVDLLWNLTRLLIEDAKLDEARQTMEQLGRAGCPQPLVGYLEARSELVRGLWLTASHRFESLRAELTPWPDLVKQTDFWLGQCYQQLGNADQQLSSFRRALEVDPFWVPARMGVAGALLSVGRVDEALEELLQVMKMDKAPAVGWLQLAQVAILRNLRLSRSDRDWTQTEQFLDRAEHAEPGSVSVTILRAEVLVAQDRVKEAEKLLGEAQGKKPESVELRLTLAALAERQRDWERTVKLLEATERDLGDGVPLRLARANYLVLRFGKEAGPQVRPLAEKTAKLPKGQLSQLWGGLAAVSLQIGDFAQARQLCRRLADADPNNLRAWLLLFDLALRAEDDADLGRVLQQIERIEGRGPLWQYGRAVHLVLQAKTGKDQPLVEALELLTKAVLARPAWSRVPLLAAEIHDRRGNEALAIDSYTRAFDLGDRSPRALRRAVQLLSQRQRFLDADRLIRRIEEQQNPFSTDLGRLASEISLRLDEFDRALEMARQAARDSKQYGDHVWLGQVLSILGQRAKAEQRTKEADEMFGEAEREFRRAVELAVEATDAWVALIRFLGRTGQKEKAEQAIVEAKQKIPAGLAPLASAQCYEVLGQLDRAEEAYQKSLAAAPGDSAVARQVAEFYLRTGKPLPAEAQLRRIAEGQIKAKEEDVAWSRRGLALILAGRGGFANLTQGLQLIDENLAKTNPAAQDRRAKAVLLASHPQRREREKAIEVLENLLKAQQLPEAADRFVLARLHLAKGDWVNGSRHMRTLLASHGNEPQYVSAYVEFLLQRNEIQEAELWLAQLEKIAPDRFSTTVLRAQAMMGRKRHAEAIDLLKGLLKKADGDAESRLTRMALVATTLNEFSFRAKKEDEKVASQYASEAESLYREYVAKRPKERLVLAAFLARQGRIDEALEITEKGWRESSLTMVSTTLLIILQETYNSPEQRKRAEAILLAALEKHERALGMLMVLADLRGIQGRSEEAQAIYREVLKKKPGNVEAMNNLALLLAFERAELKESLQLIEQAVRQAGPSANLLDSRAVVYLAVGKPQQALADLEEATADGMSPSLLFHQAQALLQVGQKGAARKALAEAKRLGLSGDRLHPLEKPAFEKLVETLK